MSVARRLAAALVVVGAGVLAFAVPASATGDHGDDKHKCVEPTSIDAVSRNLDVLNFEAEVATATVRAKYKFCDEVKVILSTYTVPETWTPEDGWSEAASPQDIYGNDVKVIEGKKPVTLTAKVKDCGGMQTDLYWWGPKGVIEKVTYPEGHAGVLIRGKGELWANLDEDGKVKECKPTTPTPTPTTPAPTPTTPAPTTPAAPTPSPTEGLGAPIPVVPPEAAPAPPQLAETGSDSTVPLLGIGILLLVAGVGLSVVGRRRTA